MGYNSAQYIHTLYQAMNLAFADRDFYYGDPYVAARGTGQGPAVEGVRAGRGAKQIDWDEERRQASSRATRTRSRAARIRSPTCWRSGGTPATEQGGRRAQAGEPLVRRGLHRRHDVDPGRRQGRLGRVGHAERRLDPGGHRRPHRHRHEPAHAELRPRPAPRTRSTCSRRGKRPRVTLTPSLALKDGKPYLCFAVQGGDTQDQNLLQFFLNVVEFGMTVQQAVEAANFNSYQMRSSFDDHESEPGRITAATRPRRRGCARSSQRMGYRLDVRAADLGPDQRDLLRLEARLDVGRVEQPRRGLRDCVVGIGSGSGFRVREFRVQPC